MTLTVEADSLDTPGIRDRYREAAEEIHRAWEWSGSGSGVLAARSTLVDGLVRELWAAELQKDASLTQRVAVAAVGGYGRRELFPFSDVDLLFCISKGDAPKLAIRSVTQQLWDCGLRVSPVTRLLSSCERLEADNVEFALALLDRRPVAGDQELYDRLDARAARMTVKDGRSLLSELLRLVEARHAKYGNTIFHLEPNVKECPGGLRDAHVAHWLRSLAESRSQRESESIQALEFLRSLRCFLHWRAGRDENTLDWVSQDAAAAAGVGVSRPGRQTPATTDAAGWMRTYFRHARIIEREMGQAMAEVQLGRRSAVPRNILRLLPPDVRLAGGTLELSDAEAADEPAPVLDVFRAMALTGLRLSAETERRISLALPVLSARLEDGPALWRQFAAVLLGRYAGSALRTMHALGVLDLLLPEFHGIDALVIRDAYHRYTVDEHTFVVFDVLHALADETSSPTPEWRSKFRSMLRELQHPELLYLAALLHDTGKGRAAGAHAPQSAAIADGVMRRWELDSYDAAQVNDLIRNHLEMSAALRRDIFDSATVRAFAARVQTPEALRMLTLFTYADIQAVHPDALTPWKAENLWRLSMGTANQLDRGLDQERVHGRSEDERVQRVKALSGGQADAIGRFLDGFPERYLATRSPEQVVEQWQMAEHLAEEPLQLKLHMAADSAGSLGGMVTHEMLLVTRDRPSLFAGMATALAAWGMNIVTADGFANGDGVVVDSFRFTDAYRTLMLNVEERERFVRSVRDLLNGDASVDKMLASRRRTRRPVTRTRISTRVEFDNSASLQSTLLQIVAQDAPGLLRVVSEALRAWGCNVELALIDTEGETAIDVFYITQAGGKLNDETQTSLRGQLHKAIDSNAM